jgi:hypothetical protein
LQVFPPHPGCTKTSGVFPKISCREFLAHFFSSSVKKTSGWSPCGSTPKKRAQSNQISDMCRGSVNNRDLNAVKPRNLAFHPPHITIRWQALENATASHNPVDFAKGAIIAS